jgi:hypothetical protein
MYIPITNAQLDNLPVGNIIPDGGWRALVPTLRTYSTGVMTLAERDMEEALAAFPQLTTYGLTDADAMRRRFGDGAEQRFRQQRDDMTAPDHLSELVACQAWLRINAATQLRIPMKPARHSNRKSATDSDLKPAGIPI